MKRRWTSLAAFVLFAAGAASTAWAQQATDYNINAVSGRYVAPPGTETTITLANGTPAGDDGWQTVALPFSFSYFGTAYSSCAVTSNGWLTFGTPNIDWLNSAFPLTSTYGSMNGTVCAYYDDLVVGPARDTVNLGTLVHWTSGTAPNRQFFVSWENVWNYGTPTGTGNDCVGPFSFQIQLFETSGTIVMAYAAGGTWPTTGTNGATGYTLGIQGPAGQYQYPANWTNSATANVGQPPSDYEIALTVVTFTGRALFDRYVVNASGIGATSEQNVVLAGTRVDARNASNVVVGSTLTDPQGYYTLVAYGVPPTVVGSIVVCAENAVCSVRTTAGGAPLTATLRPNLSFAADLDVGTLTLNETTDPGGAARAPVNVARTVQSVHTWAQSRTTSSIPFLAVLCDPASTFGTSYTPVAGSTPASMRISMLSTNPDPWDPSVIRRTYARHVLAALAASPTSTYNAAFDSLTDTENAFAEAFGYYLNAIVSGDQNFFDGRSSTVTTVLDLEGPSGLVSNRGPNGTAWVAQSLFDLVDGANEAWDTVNGLGVFGERIFGLVDSQTAPVTAASLYAAWLGASYDPLGITQNFIHHGLLSDDANEPNDSPAAATPIAQFGFNLTSRTLNLFNEDWYAFSLPEATASLTVSAAYDRANFASVALILEVTSPSGVVLATGSTSDATGPIRAVTGALPAGSYRIHVGLAAGGPLPAYSLQAFSRLTFKSDRFPDWTVNRPYSVSVNIVGGIPPYALTVPPPYVGPPGLVLDGNNGLISGTPRAPAGGLGGGSKTFDFVVSALDSATPSNSASKLLSFTLNDAVTFHFGEFMAFALAKPADRPWPAIGGTAPYTVSVDTGALPSGLLTETGGVLRFKGTPDAAGSFSFGLTATDVAGSTTSATQRAVVCVPMGTAELAAGASACGFWFDALQGSSVGISIATGKGKPVRVFRVVMVASDGFTSVPATVKVKKGKATVSGFVAPVSGRYYCILVSDDAGAVTSFTAKPKITPAKSGSGSNGATTLVETASFPVAVPALAGTALTFSAKPSKGAALALKVLRLLDPAGAEVPLLPGEVKVKSGAVSFKRTLPASGIWTVVLGAEPGTSGLFTYSFKLKHPSGVAFAAD